MIKAVVFDFIGVLFNWGTPIAIKELHEHYGYDETIIRKLLFSKQSIKLRKGKITDKQFWNYARKVLPKNYSVKLIKEVWNKSYKINKEVFDIIKELRRKNSKLKIVSFSGNVRSRLFFLDKKYHFKKYFDIGVYSFDYGYLKPSMKFVRIMLKKVACEPKEILYIDDSKHDVEPAVKLGINVFIYKKGNIDKLRKELERYKLL